MEWHWVRVSMRKDGCAQGESMVSLDKRLRHRDIMHPQVIRIVLVSLYISFSHIRIPCHT